MIYQIPDSKLKKLEKMCNHIRNKGAEVTFNIKEPCFIVASNNEKVSVPGHEVEVEGFYRINDWEFIATIEHKTNGNIIRAVLDDKDIPSKYRTCGPECEHCHRIRDRKDTYLIRNILTDEYKQVGKSCLREYTSGLDANVCAEMNAFFALVEDSGWKDDFNISYNTNKYLDANTFKSFAYPIIKKTGYIKDVTVDKILESIYGRGEDEVEPIDKKELEPIDEYVESLDASYGYLANAKVAWKQKYLEFRDLALVASFIAHYFKHLNQLEQQKHNMETTNWVGNIGDEIYIKIASYRVLFENHYEVAYHTYANSYTYEIIDDKGNTFIWKSSKLMDLIESEEGMIHIKPLELKGKIKDHSEYKGTKQTVLTRCKIIKYEPLNKNIQSNRDAFKALDDLIDDLDN